MFGLLFLAASISNALMCPNLLWETWTDCGNGVAPGSNGCCANGQCPPGCRSTGSSCCPTVCTCTDCPFARKPLLKAMSIPDQWVAAHNYYRCRHGQNPLAWDTQVATNAQNYANTCPNGHSRSYENVPPSGENMAQGFANAFDAVSWMYSEIENYTPQPSGEGLCSSVCGHYTAIIWGGVTALGCGSCASNKMDICQYAREPPNWNPQTASVANVPRTNTPVNDEATCCNRVFLGATPTTAPTPPPACAVDTTTWGTWPVTQPGVAATLVCPPGYTGNVRRLCGNNGVWQDVDSSTCVAKIPDCPAENGWATTSPGASATRACPTGAVGSNTRQCSAAGAWAQEVNTCVVPATCSDGMQNQGEQGVDCGCTTCSPPCPTCLVCGTINCGSHGSCVEPNAVCICKDGYTGSRCETPPVDPCAGVNCGTHGACNAGKCACFSGWTGPACETVLAPTCTDGIQNSDEAGIDCGGTVAKCFTCPNHQWSPDAWSTCSKTCGGGVQARTVNCMDTTTSTAVSANFCGNAHTFTTSQQCNVDACPTYTWQAGTWGPCSTACNGGVQTRTVECLSSAGNVVVTTGCDLAVKPAVQQDCNTVACTLPRWVADTWTACTATCGGGSQTRTVQCQDQDNKMIAEALCVANEKPTLQQSCNLMSCDSYRWKACPTFYPCTAQCNGGGAMAGIQYRDVFCVRSSDSAAVDSSLCDTQTQPTTSLSVCNTQPCSNYNWMADGNWGPCTLQKETGLYLRTRTFHCHAADGTTVLRQNCVDKAGKLPIASIPCTAGTCANADGCPTVEIAEVLNSCDANALETCAVDSLCYQAANDVDVSFLTVGVSAATAVRCFSDYVASLAVSERPSTTALQTIISRLEGGEKICGVSLSGALSVAPFLGFLMWMFL